MTYYRQARSRFTIDQLVSIENAAMAGDVDVNAMPAIVATENANGVSIVNHQNTRNFDLPEHYMPEIIMEMAHMIGINVRDTSLVQYGLKLSTEQ